MNIIEQKRSGSSRVGVQRKRTREENVAKFGCNYEKEAKGLAIVRDVLEADGRLEMQKCAEGARADFCVYFPGCPSHAVGCQLKTTHGYHHHQNGHSYYNFRYTAGYEGLLVILVACVEDEEVKVWLRPGSTIAAQTLSIPKQAKGDWGYDWTVHAVELADLTQALATAFLLNDIQHQPVCDLIKPTSSTQLVEYESHLRLEDQMPLPFKPPSSENQHHDYTVNGERWQMKVASYLARDDIFVASVKKSAGQRISQQYEVNDFDWLAILMPEHHLLRNLPPRMYLIPMHTLEERGVVGRNLTGATIPVYPHRVSRANSFWANAFEIDLSTPSTALAGYHRMLFERGTVDTSVVQL